MQRAFLLTFCCLILGVFANAQTALSPVGTWKSIDDQTGEAKSHVKIYEADGKLFGEIVKILRKDAPPNALCVECKGNKKDKPILGMQIIDGLKQAGERWKGGSILDPESGNTYSCLIWLPEGEEDELKVRGVHWTGIYRTQTWYRVE